MVHTLTADYIILITFVGVLAAFVDRTLWAAAAIGVAGLIGTAFAPGAVFEIAAAVLVLVGGVSAWAVRPLAAE